jgi:hypothetical protein
LRTVAEESFLVLAARICLSFRVTRFLRYRGPGCSFFFSFFITLVTPPLLTIKRRKSVTTEENVSKFESNFKKGGKNGPVNSHLGVWEAAVLCFFCVD